ncbi:2-amino-4-hydroxy-6-hydroxymethyldihydropteridine diphosphokinase, partial [Candidatus Parcubacteria bacterium]
MSVFYLGLGSNVGERLQHLQRARTLLGDLGGLLGWAPVFVSEPWGDVHQPPFLNTVLVLQTACRPFRLLRKLKQIECRLGRSFTRRWGPRVIDLDLLEWDGPEIRSAVLTLPHPLLAQRLFVLKPLQAVAPGFRLRSGQRVEQLVGLLDRPNACECYAMFPIVTISKELHTK